jgi:hypothetical protein
MRWARLFDDLNAQVEAAERAERAAESAELRRLELSRVTLSDRLLAAVGTSVTLTVDGAQPLTGELVQLGGDWALLASETGSETLVGLSAVVAVTGLPAAVAAGAGAGETDARLGLGFVLRRLARDRLPVTVVTRGGTAYTGTIDRVAADFFDLAEHAADRPRRATDVQRVRTIAFAATALVRPA